MNTVTLLFFISSVDSNYRPDSELSGTFTSDTHLRVRDQTCASATTKDRIKTGSGSEATKASDQSSRQRADGPEPQLPPVQREENLCLCSPERGCVSAGV